jgi:hypothetical protein
MNRIEELLDYVRLVIEQKAGEEGPTRLIQEDLPLSYGDAPSAMPISGKNPLPYFETLAAWAVSRYAYYLSCEEIFDQLRLFYLDQSRKRQDLTHATLADVLNSWKWHMEEFASREPVYGSRK